MNLFKLLNTIALLFIVCSNARTNNIINKQLNKNDSNKSRFLAVIPKHTILFDLKKKKKYITSKKIITWAKYKEGNPLFSLIENDIYKLIVKSVNIKPISEDLNLYPNQERRFSLKLEKEDDIELYLKSKAQFENNKITYSTFLNFSYEFVETSFLDKLFGVNENIGFAFNKSLSLYLGISTMNIFKIGLKASDQTGYFQFKDKSYFVYDNITLGPSLLINLEGFVNKKLIIEIAYQSTINYSVEGLSKENSISSNLLDVNINYMFNHSYGSAYVGIGNSVEEYQVNNLSIAKGSISNSDYNYSIKLNIGLYLNGHF